LQEIKRIVKKSIFILTPLFWTDNHINIHNKKSPYYQNMYNEHKSLWTREDFIDWIEIKEVKFKLDMYLGEWKQK